MELGLQFSDDDFTGGDQVEERSSDAVSCDYVVKEEGAGWFGSSSLPESETLPRRAALHYARGDYRLALADFERIWDVHGDSAPTAVCRHLLDCRVRCLRQLGSWEEAGKLLRKYRELVVNSQQLFCWLQLTVELAIEGGREVCLHMEEQLDISLLVLTQWLVELDEQNPLLWKKLALIYSLHITPNCHLRSLTNSSETAPTPFSDADCHISSHSIDPCSHTSSDSVASDCGASSLISDNNSPLRGISTTTTSATLCPDPAVGGSPLISCRCEHYYILAQLHCYTCWEVVRAGCGGLLEGLVGRGLEESERVVGNVSEAWRKLARNALTVRSVPTAADVGEFVDRGSSRYIAAGEAAATTKLTAPDQHMFEHKWFSPY